MRILLTGAGGNLGRHINGRHDRKRHHLVALRHSDLDITDAAAIEAAMEAHRPELVINAAAYNDVDGAEANVARAFDVNEAGPRNLARATAKGGAALVHVSSDYVFDGEKSTPYDENDKPNPLSAYAKSKLAGEGAVREANPRSYIARTAWVFAEEGNNFPNTILKLARSHDRLRVIDDVKGSPTYAGHLADAILRLVETEMFGTFHLAGAGEGASWFDFANALFREMTIETPIVPVASTEFPRPAKRPGYSVLRTIKTPQILLPPWQKGVAEFAYANRHSQEK